MMCGPQVKGALGGDDPNNPFKPVGQSPQLQGLPPIAAADAWRAKQMTASQPRMVQ